MRHTLTDVMRGIKKHKLADKLQDGVYKFLIELILEANELGFKNPIDLTVQQALAIGGGRNRQTLYNRRGALRKIRIDGKHLVKVNVGSYGQGSLATYEIDYDLLCLYNGVWSKENVPLSNEIDEGLTMPLRRLDETLDDALPILREDQKRSEETTSEAMSLVKLMQEKWPHPNPPSESRIQHMIDRYTLGVCVDAMHRTREDMGNGSWDSIYNYMTKVAVGLTPETPKKAMSDEDMAVLKMKRIIADYRSIDPDTGIGKTGGTESAIINIMRPYAEWYDAIDNFGAIVGMEREEYEGLTNGGVK